MQLGFFLQNQNTAQQLWPIVPSSPLISEFSFLWHNGLLEQIYLLRKYSNESKLKNFFVWEFFVTNELCLALYMKNVYLRSDWPKNTRKLAADTYFSIETFCLMNFFRFRASLCVIWTTSNLYGIYVSNSVFKSPEVNCKPRVKRM